MTTTKDTEDKVKFCSLHKVWYIEGEQPCKACQEERKNESEQTSYS